MDNVTETTAVTATTANKAFEGNFKFPEGLAREALRLAALLVPCLLVSLLVNTTRLGSVTALCFALPLAVILGDLWHRRHEARVLVQAALTLGAVAGVALDPGWLNMALSWVMLLALAIEARSGGTHAAAAALAAVSRAILGAPFGLTQDAWKITRRLPVKPGHFTRLPFTSLVLPAVALVVFAGLFTEANPHFEALLRAIDVGNPLASLDRLLWTLTSIEVLAFVGALLMLWPVLRGTTEAKAYAGAEADTPNWHALFFKPLAVALTMLVLNLMFALENSLDLQHLWLTPPEPGTYNHAGYVHRGAYTLIATAALAGVLMLTALRKGTATEAAPLVRGLVYVFAAQNLMLVASSVQRTLLYIEAYGWTEWRVSGLIWMALVFFGLATIFWRIARNRDARWLINTNIMATAVLLVGVGLWDMQGFVARKNVERALAAAGPMLDLPYVNQMSANALPAVETYAKALAERQRVNTEPQQALALLVETRRAETVAHNLRKQFEGLQSDWRRWSLRLMLVR